VFAAGKAKLILLDRCGFCSRKTKKSKRCSVVCFPVGEGWLRLKRFFHTVLFSERSSLYASTLLQAEHMGCGVSVYCLFHSEIKNGVYLP